MRLKDKVCVITGAGMGIGRMAALMFAREGAKVVVADILEKDGMETVDLVTRVGGQAVFVPVDIRKAAQVREMAAVAAATYGRIDVLYNNAAIRRGSEDHMIADLEEAVWDEIMDINLKGTYLCTKYVIPEMVKAGGGAIVNTSSAAALSARELPAYTASKGGILAMSRVIARQYSGSNIRVNCICPGTTRTERSSAMRADRGKDPLAFPEKEFLMRRMAEPEEIVAVALFLASDEASFVTGASWAVDGGWTAT